ncbi:MAG: TM2 domain-containing protein [Paludibacteraceae bacterium]|nr:TM2 domain-containing protein [Paludibacteraceae bacterium]
MDSQKVDMFLMSNSENFRAEQIPAIRTRLLALDDSKWQMLSCIQFKKPLTALLFSFFLGGFGADRFYIGQTGLGVLKLLTCGGCGVWSIIDLFLIMGATRDVNLLKAQQYIY